jgi:hypothetical protein
MPEQLSATPAGPAVPRTLFLGDSVVRPLLSTQFRRPEVRGYGQPTRPGWEAFLNAVTRGLEVDVDYSLKLRPGGLKTLTAANVGFLAASPPDRPPEGLRQLRGGSLGVWAAEDTKPRAYVVFSARTRPDRRAVRGSLRDADFDPRREVLLEEPSPLPPTSGSIPEASPRAARTVSYENSEVVVATSTDRRGLLVLSDSHYPGWEAEVDGRRTDIYRANGLFRAVAIPPGRHTVRFSYRPASVYVGAGVSLAGAGLIAGFGLLGRRRRYPAFRPDRDSASGAFGPGDWPLVVPSRGRRGALALVHRIVAFSSPRLSLRELVAGRRILGVEVGLPAIALVALSTGCALAALYFRTGLEGATDDDPRLAWAAGMLGTTMLVALFLAIWLVLAYRSWGSLSAKPREVGVSGVLRWMGVAIGAALALLGGLGFRARLADQMFPSLPVVWQLGLWSATAMVALTVGFALAVGARLVTFFARRLAVALASWLSKRPT